MNFAVTFFFLFAMLLATGLLFAQPDRAGINYDEQQVGEIKLPDILKTKAGKTVTTRKEWETLRRPEILADFETFVYGKAPERPTLQFKTISTVHNALQGTAIHKEVEILFASDTTHRIRVLMYLPNRTRKPVPVFVGLNFYGNQTIHSDTGIHITAQWVPDRDSTVGVVDNRATASSRGTRAGRWPVEKIIARGYGIVTAYNGDLDADYHDGFKNGVHPLFYKPGQLKPDSSEWGTIGAWAWGLQCIMDYLQTDTHVDGKKIAVLGHSRLGKAALWAGALDERFAIVISNESGEGGASLSRRNFGQTVQDINTTFPHWFCQNFKKFNDNPDKLPVDQHMLVALIAPRAVYIASAAEDLWADPKGEYLSLVYGSKAYSLYNYRSLDSPMPVVDKPVMKDAFGYHIRSGKHNIVAYDWEQFLNFGDYYYNRSKR